MAQSQFSILFNRSADIYRAIKSVVSHTSNDGGMLDPTAVVRELVSNYPDVSIPPASLLEEVVQAASEAGLSLSVRVPE